MHQPVLLQELIEELTIQPAHIVIDATLGGGGYSKAISERLGKTGTLVGIDQDGAAVERTRLKLGGATCSVYLREANFRTLDQVLNDLKIDRVNGIAMDLGFSSDQLETSERGFSFQKDEPLLMTFKENPTKADLTAHDIVSAWSEEHLADIINGFGEERFAKRIARAIVGTRETKSIDRTKELSEIITQAVPRWYTFRKLHPATKTFQALRIAVNDELGALREGIEKGIERLAPKGRFAIVSFHSVEDRVVKTHFRTAQQKGLGQVVTKKPLVPTQEEITDNPRARSAKLRIFEKV